MLTENGMDMLQSVMENHCELYGDTFRRAVLTDVVTTDPNIDDDTLAEIEEEIELFEANI